MKKSVVKAFSWDFSGSIIGYGASFITSVLLSRLLAPSEFGIVAIALSFVYIFSTLTEFGFRQALIQAKENSQATYTSVFYANMLLALLLCIILCALAPFVAQFYDAPIIRPAMMLLSLVIFFNSLTIVQIAILSLDLDFKSLSIRMIIAKVISSIFGIILAYQGLGVMAIVWQEILFSFINALLLWYLSDWRPGSWRLFDFNKLKKLTSFSIYLLLSKILNDGLQRIDDLFVGKVFSTSTLGYFDRSNSISQQINGVTSKSITNVFFPVMSKLQDEPQQFARMYDQVMLIITTCSFLLTGLCYLSSHALIIGLFGEQWYASIPIFEILMFKLFTYPASRFLNVALLSKGYSKQHFYFGLIRKLFRLSIYIVAWIYGFEAFLYASVIVSFINILFTNIVNTKYLSIGFWRQTRPMIIGGLILIVSLIIATTINTNNDDLLSRTIWSCTLFTVIFTLITYLLHRRKLSSIIATYLSK